MAPEMFTPGLRNTPVEIYSLGCTYIELFGKRKVWPELRTGPEIMQTCVGHSQTHQ